MANSYPYRPIVGSSIRLIRVLEETSSYETIHCKLIHLPLDTSPPLQYLALSYTWGDFKNSKATVYVDGHAMTVPVNLWHALKAIRDWEAIDVARGYGPRNHNEVILMMRRPWLVWADALCINQADFEEKSREIPRMKDIFGGAEEVLGWLDHRFPPSIDNAAVNHILELGKELARRVKSSEIEWYTLSLASDKELSNLLGVKGVGPIMRAAYAIAALPWFSRLWIIQENAVSSYASALALGYHLFDSFDFHVILVALSHRPMWYQWPVSLECALAMGRIRERHHHNMGIGMKATITAIPETTNELDAFAYRLHGLLAKAGSAPFESTIEHDMIYGLLSIAAPPTPMPPELAIDYTKPWTEVCRHYARFIAERTCEISFLMRVRPGESDWRNFDNVDEIPSWVPNFARMGIVLSYPWMYIETDRFKNNKITFSEDGLAMTLDAYIIGKPTALTRRANLVQALEVRTNDTNRGLYRRADARDFICEILEPAARLQGRSLDNVIYSWIRTWDNSLDGSRSGSEVPLIKRTFKRWAKGKGPDELSLREERICGHFFSERARGVWSRLMSKSLNKNWIVTPDGRGWVTLFLSEVKPDDLVVILRGLEEHPAVLRKTSEGRHFRLMGLLIERVPLEGKMWEHICKERIESSGKPWTRITLI